LDSPLNTLHSFPGMYIYIYTLIPHQVLNLKIAEVSSETI
jgi:uncharacterized RmlC-like cupin family protein